MNTIEKMIKAVCPEGVEHKPLSECAESYTGAQLNKSKMQEIGLYAVMNGGVAPSGYYDEFTEEGETITVSQGGASSGYVNWNQNRFWLGAHCYAVHPKENTNNRYLYHTLKEKQNDLMHRAQGAGIPGLNRSALNNIIIPLPPLSIQQEIVNRLDRFTDLLQNLEDELKLRQKQYEYYREKLMTFEEGEYEWKKLGEIGKMKRGNGLMKSDLCDHGFPCIHYGQVHTYYGTFTDSTKSFCNEELATKLKKANTGDLIIATTSEDVEACCKAVVWLGEGEVAYSGDSHCFSHNQNPKYISYLFQTEQFSKQKRKAATGAKVVRVSGDSMERFIFPIPSLERQAEIVSILDHFESLISNIKTEIELRKKQYEYYREKLLTF